MMPGCSVASMVHSSGLKHTCQMHRKAATVGTIMDTLHGSILNIHHNVQLYKVTRYSSYKWLVLACSLY